MNIRPALTRPEPPAGRATPTIAEPHADASAGAPAYAARVRAWAAAVWRANDAHHALARAWLRAARGV